MDYIRLGSTNLMVPRVGLGAMGLGSSSWRPWVRDEEASRSVLARALELGVNFFDSCDYYSSGASEQVLGSYLWKEVGREEVVIATKVGNPVGPGPNGRGYSRKHIFSAVEESLRRLAADYIDLYQTHIWDVSTNIEEVVGAFSDLVEAGKVRYFGFTDVPAWQVAKALYLARHAGKAAPASVQFHYNLVWRGAEQELLDFCGSEGLGLLPYSPLARGFLASPAGHSRQTVRGETDDFSKQWYSRPEDEAVRAAVEAVAAARGASPAAVALAWVLGRCPGSTPLLGVTEAGQLDAVEEALSLQLEAEETARLEAGYLPRASYGH